MAKYLSQVSTGIFSECLNLTFLFRKYLRDDHRAFLAIKGKFVHHHRDPLEKGPII